MKCQLIGRFFVRKGIECRVIIISPKNKNDITKGGTKGMRVTLNLGVTMPIFGINYEESI